MCKKRFLLVAGLNDYILRFRGELLAEIAAKGYEVHIACAGLPPEGAITRRLVALGYRTHDLSLRRTGRNPLEDLFTLLSMIWIIAFKIKPNLILAYGAKPVIYAGIASKIAKRSRFFAMITGLGFAFQEENKNSLLSSLVRNLYRISLSNAEGLIFQNDDDKNLFEELAVKARRENTLVINGSGVNLDQFPVAVLPSSPRFLMCARLLKSKGVREYLAAAELTRKAFPDATFAIAGLADQGPDAVDPKEFSEATQRGPVEYLGKLEDVRPAIAAVSVFVLPSYREGTPRSVLEAMAMGRPVVTTNVPGCKGTVVEGFNGFLVEPRDAAAIASAMSKLAASRSMREEFGKASRLLAEEKFSVNLINANILEFLGVGSEGSSR